MTRPRTLDYDVAVVGASVAGLRAAGLLAAAGRRVAVFDARRAPGHPERTWIVTRQIAPVLGFTPDEAVVHETDVMRLASAAATRDVRLDPPDLIVERSKLLPLLADRAAADGAALHTGHRVESFRAADGAIELGVRPVGGDRRRTVRVRHLIGADGVRSDVAAAFGAAPLPAVPIVQARVRLPGGWDPAVTAVWFEPEATSFFYWLIPESTETGVAGLVADRPAGSRAALERFLERHGLGPLDYQAAVIPLYRPRRRIAWRLEGGGRVLLVGDAAGHVKVTTVGGVVSGLWGARAAASALLSGRSYRKELAGLHRELYVHHLIRRAMSRFGAADYDRLLGVLNRPLERFLARENRDTVAPNLVRLLAAQPRLLTVGLRALLPGSRPGAGRAAEAPRRAPSEYAPASGD